MRFLRLKMKSAIKEIYNNEGGYYDTIELSEEYCKEQAQFDKIFEELLKAATKEQEELLNELFDKFGGLQSELGETHFIEGFKLGFRLATECLK